jgi:hypothetical protein
MTRLNEKYYLLDRKSFTGLNAKESSGLYSAKVYLQE